MLNLTNGFLSDAFSGALLNFSLSGIKNPVSLEPSTSFNVSVFDKSGYGLYTAASTLNVTMTKAASLNFAQVIPSSKKNNQSDSYGFIMTLSNTLSTGNYIKVAFPSQISVNADSSGAYTCIGT